MEMWEFWGGLLGEFLPGSGRDYRMVHQLFTTWPLLPGRTDHAFYIYRIYNLYIFITIYIKIAVLSTFKYVYWTRCPRLGQVK